MKICPHGINEKFCQRCTVSTVATMSFQTAAKFVMPFGMYKGKTLEQIAASDRGLGYLDWLRGKMDDEKDMRATSRAIRVYLDDPSIQKELDNHEDRNRESMGRDYALGFEDGD